MPAILGGLFSWDLFLAWYLAISSDSFISLYFLGAPHGCPLTHWMYSASFPRWFSLSANGFLARFGAGPSCSAWRLDNWVCMT